MTRPPRRRSTGQLLGAVVCAGLVWGTAGCGSMNPDTEDYREQASLTLGTAVSELATTRLYLQQLAQGDVFPSSATSQILASDQALGSSVQSFTSLNPPEGAGSLPGRCGTLLSAAQDAVAAVRLAVHRDDTARYPALMRELDRLRGKLQDLEDQASS